MVTISDLPVICQGCCFSMRSVFGMVTAVRGVTEYRAFGVRQLVTERWNTPPFNGFNLALRGHDGQPVTERGLGDAAARLLERVPMLCGDRCPPTGIKTPIPEVARCWWFGWWT